MLNRIVIVIALFIILPACEMANQPVAEMQFVHHGMTMGTSFSIKAPTIPEQAKATDLKQKIDELLHAINNSMSTYIETSELTHLNNNSTSEWLHVSRPLLNVLTEADRISRLSNGAFDVTVAPLVNLWGFGPDPLQLKAPPDEKIAESLNQVGYQHLELDNKGEKIKKAIAGLRLDLSALAKGYAVDRVAELLQDQGVKDYLVEIGGEMRLKGHKQKQQLWRIAIEKPTPDKRMVQKIIPVTDASIATSGDYRNYFEVEGVRFSHTIDPRTGRPITHDLASVTVIRPSAMEADALATAFMVMGAEAGLKLAEKENISALFIMKSNEGFIEKSTSLFDELQR